MSAACRIVVIGLTALFVLGSSAGAAEPGYKERYAEKTRKLEEAFQTASRAGETVHGVLLEGNSLFNGTIRPQDRPWGEPYTARELNAAKHSAERNSTVFLLARDGTLYYFCPPSGQAVSGSTQAQRFPRVRTPEQKAEELFSWATLVPMVGRQVEVYGEVYSGYGGVKGLAIRAIAFEGEYIVGKNGQEEQE